MDCFLWAPCWSKKFSIIVRLPSWRDGRRTRTCSAFTVIVAETECTSHLCTSLLLSTVSNLPVSAERWRTSLRLCFFQCSCHGSIVSYLKKFRLFTLLKTQEALHHNCQFPEAWRHVFCSMSSSCDANTVLN